MGVDIGASAISAAYIGSTAVQNIYLGSTNVWSAKASFSDTFARSNSTTGLGGNWTAGAGTLGIIGTTYAYPVGTQTSYWNTARWATPVNTDDQQVTLTMGPAVGSDGGVLAILGASSAGAGLAVYWYTTTATIYTVTGLWTTSQSFTSRATSAAQTTPASADTLSVKRVGNVYTCYHNGTQTITWTDSGNALTRGSSNRLVGLGMLVSAAGQYRQLDTWAANDV